MPVEDTGTYAGISGRYTRRAIHPSGNSQSRDRNRRPAGRLPKRVFVFSGLGISLSL